MFAFLALMYAISATLMLGLGVFIYYQDKKSETHKTFLLLCYTNTFWIVTLYFYYSTNNPDAVLILGRLNFASVFPFAYQLLKFSENFPFVRKPFSKVLKRSLVLFTVVLTFVTTFSPLISTNEKIIGPYLRETSFGPLYIPFILYFLIVNIVSVVILYRKIKLVRTKIEKYQIIYVAVGTSVALFLNYLTNIILYSLGVVYAPHFGVLAPVIFVVSTAYAIYKYRLLDIRLALAELLVGTIAIILLVQTFFSDTLWIQALSGFVFVAFCFFGYLLIKSVLQEIKQKEELAKLSKLLEETNTQLKHLDETKSEFVSIASHQLRTPLTVIKGYLSMIQEGSFGKIPEPQQAPLDKVYESANRLIELVENLLSVSRIESGRMKYNYEPTQLADMASSVVDEIIQAAKKKNLHLQYDAPREALPVLNIDAEKLRQVMMNLVDNAVKYTKKGSVVVSLYKDDGHTNPRITEPSVVFQVKDTGNGVRQDDQDRLFQKFIRGQGSSLVHTEGTGLGLYVGRMMVEAHNGKIWVESRGEGYGSIFAFAIPTSKSSSAPATTPPPTEKKIEDTAKAL